MGLKIFTGADEITQLVTKESDIDIAKNLTLPFNNRTAVCRSNSDTLRELAIYADGFTIVVDYFRKLDSYIDKKTADITLPLLDGDYVDKSFDLIKDLEIKLNTELDSQPDEDLTEWSITGEGTMYPGTFPRKGDAFIYKLDTGQVGLFVIDSQTPLSIGADNMFHINFHLFRILDIATLKKMKDAVVNTYYFDKEAYFNSSGALLTADECIDIDESKKFIQKLMFDLQNNYFDEEAESFLIPYPGGKPLFDPFFVEFYNVITETDDNCKRPVQMIERYKDHLFKKTIWNKFCDPTDSMRISFKFHARCVYRRSYFDPYKNGLVNRDVLGLTSSVDYITLNKRFFSDNVICKEDFVRKDDVDVPFYAVSGNMYRLLNGEPPQNTEAQNEDFVILKFQTLEEFVGDIPEGSEEDLDITEFEKCLYYVRNNVWDDNTKRLIKETIVDEYPYDGLTHPFRAYKVLLSLYVLKNYVLWLKKAL